MKLTPPAGRLAISLVPAAALIFGCLAPLEFGEPEAPTDAQLEAVALMSEGAGLVHSALAGSSTGRKTFAMHALMAELHTLAVLDPSPIAATGEVPPLHPLCIAGSPSVGYRYDHCLLDADGFGSVEGSALIDEAKVDYDLRMSWASQDDQRNSANLGGHFELIDDRIYGELELRISIMVPGREGVLGIDPGEGIGDVNTSSVWAVAYDEEAGCITDGYVDIEVEARGDRQATRYTFEGCKLVPTVRNAAD